jgi:O-methyltransferase
MSQQDVRPPTSLTTADGSKQLYLDLLKKMLTRCYLKETWQPVAPRRGSARYWLYLPGKHFLKRRGMEIVRRVPLDSTDVRSDGRDRPLDAETMVGLKRLDNLDHCIADVIDQGVPGDLIETGVWRGGSVIFMRAALKAHGDTERVVWVADSFRGLPKPDPTHPDDVEDKLWSQSTLSVPIEEVRENFARYGMLDQQVKFLPGWFSDTLPSAPIDRLSILRLDGDLYESTMTALRSLYPKLSVGGYVIVDDYYAVRGCRRAVDDFRAQLGIEDEMRQVDWTCVFWRRSG